MVSVDALERAFGDPFDASNPLGFAAIVDADERAEPLAVAESVLDDHQFGAEFVPSQEGGRLRSLPELVRASRAVARRDLALCLGYGITSFMAAANVWMAGSAEQRRGIARLLLGGGRVAVGYHELGHGNDLLANDLTAQRDGGGFTLTGEKHVINNLERAGAIVLFCRTDPAPGGRSHSLLLVDTALLDQARVHRLPRFRTVGVQGCRLGGVRLDGARVPGDAIVGELGHGVEIALRSFQVTRAALPGVAIGALDSALRTTMAFARGRRLYGATVADLPHARSMLAGAFADLLACDALALVAARAVHVIPAEAGVLAAATKSLVPAVLTAALHDLSIVLGARFYLREGEHAIFQKFVRDLPAVALGHAGSAACQATLLPHLPGLARTAWGMPTDAPPDLFAIGDGVAPLRWDALSLATPHHDSLLGALEPGLAELTRCTGTRLGAALMQAHTRLRDECVRLRPIDRTPLGAAAGFDLAVRYALLVAASACVNVWLHHCSRPEHVGDPVWAVGALTRLLGRLTGADIALEPWVEAGLLAELARRHHAALSFDLDERPLFSAASRIERKGTSDAIHV